MQHITHIFIGKELVTFRDQFAATYRRLHEDFEHSLFSAISLTTTEAGDLVLCPDDCDCLIDDTVIGAENYKSELINYFEDMYGRKVTVAHPGNQSLVVVIWAKLYDDDVTDSISKIVEALTGCTSNFYIELAGFTHDAVSCFIPNAKDRLSPDVYKKHFDDNIAKLIVLRPRLSAFRLIANRNMQNVALDLDDDTLARVCAEYSALMCEHYQAIHSSVIDHQTCPFESFGVSSIIFDLQYYKQYIRNRIVIDKLQGENIDERTFNINALAKKTNPLLQDTLDQIHNFNDQVTGAKASLSLSSQMTTSNVVGEIDNKLKDIAKDLRAKIDALVENGSISVFESEALLCLLLGNDCSMFETSVVDAKELILDDIIDESAKFFVDIDSDKTMLTDVSQDEIQQIRTRMRNIAVANRRRKERLKELDIHRKEAANTSKHIDGNGYRFGDIDYKVDLTIDDEPLEQTYEAHSVSQDSVDLRSIFAPIRNQGRQGSCASFAVASVIEALRKDSNRYSPAFLYWNARVATNSCSNDDGASLYGVIKAAKDKGVCTEELMPYNPDIYTVAPSETANASAMDCRVLEAKTVNLKLADIKSALSDGLPVIVAAQIFDSFSETRSGFVRHPSSEELASGKRKDGHGNHALVVCGYSDKERVLVVRNSWGTNFGDNGYCYIPYSYAQQYFRQACVITGVSSAADIAGFEKKTINFNLNDNNIEAAILQNLIAEDDFELSELSEESSRLRTIWTQNIAKLGNVNNQAALVQKCKDDVAKQIKQENETIAHLQSSEDGKIKDFKKGYYKKGAILFFVCLVAWLFVYWHPTSKITWGIADIVSLIFLFFIGNYNYQWRKFRQDLRDEIARHAANIDRLREWISRVEVDAHIHGSILQHVNKERLSLLSECTRLQAFNAALLDLYDKTDEELKTMSPIEPYPFRAVLDNANLDKYYTAWRHKMVEALNLKTLFASYNKGAEIEQLLAEDSNLNRAVVRGLRNFTMREYVTTNNRDKWQFLPDAADMGEVFPDLDARAIPFCPYNPPTGSALEKYIFIKDITSGDMAGIQRYFTQQPLPISNTNPYAISIINIVRYNLTQQIS
jgi:C1A family cysteine protease